jgi:hypothetical protein
MKEFNHADAPMVFTIEYVELKNFTMKGESN